MTFYKTPRIMISLRPLLLDRLEKACAVSGVTKSAFISLLLDTELKKRGF